MGLEQYREKRRFEQTPEPKGEVKPSGGGRMYLIQKHAASRLHYDLRLELDGVLKSWAIPKGPSLNPSNKRLAAHVEDHPIEYGSFEGIIPKNDYGGGTVMLWDRGVWEPEGDPRQGYAKGDLKFTLHGERLKGKWVLVRMKGPAGEAGKNWLLIKKHDKEAKSEVSDEPAENIKRSVASGRTMDEIASEAEEKMQGEATAGLDETGEGAAGRGISKNDAGKTAVEIDFSKLTGARRAPQPAFIRPELATLAGVPPRGEDWIHEIKYDGYRIECVLSGGRARLISRNGKEWTDRFSEIARAASAIPVANAIMDGEVVVIDPEGRTDFQALQNILQGSEKGSLTYLVFDIPFCGGYDLTHTPLLERKELLRRILDAFPDGSQIRYSDHIPGQGDTVFEHACGLSLEGIVSKHADSSYEQQRSRRWVKVKCGKRQEFVIGGFTDPGGSRSGFGALLVGYYDSEGELIYCGKVGTGFNEKMLETLSERLRAIEISKPAFINPPSGYEARGTHWIGPELVGEVEFGSWTEEGKLRQPSFKGLRADKAPREITRENPEQLNTESGAKAGHVSGPKPAGDGQPANEGRISGRKDFARVKITNPERVFYSDIGVTKGDLVEYYTDVAEWILPHLRRRPLTLVRCPEGWEKQCFFQKHLGDTAQRVLRPVSVTEKHGEEVYSVLDDIEGVIALVQLGALEIHVWGSRDDKLEQPDVMIFDLDPAEDVPWARMIRAAILMRDRLLDLGLTSFVKTTGGKGLHIVAPLSPKADWDAVKEFSRGVAESIVREFPGEYIATMSKEKRKGKIFIDYLRNGRSATSVAAYSTRARSGCPISTPISWDEISEELKPDSFNIRNIRTRLSQLKKDPWDGYFSVRQTITDAAIRTAPL